MQAGLHTLFEHAYLVRSVEQLTQTRCQEELLKGDICVVHPQEAGTFRNTLRDLLQSSIP